MRAYTLTILTQLANTGHPVVEKEIVEWVNNKVINILRALLKLHCIKFKIYSILNI